MNKLIETLDYLLNRKQRLITGSTEEQTREIRLKVSGLMSDLRIPELPSRFLIGEKVLFSVSQEYGPNPYPLQAFVRAVHFYPGKVKYDLEIPIYDESPTRIYNVDSCFVLPV